MTGMQKSTVILGDCMKIMKEYPDKYFDLAVVDPPYGSAGGGHLDTLRGLV